jgi:hypothetical protein
MSGSGGGPQGFAVVIEAVDRASKQIEEINKKISSMQKPARDAQRAIDKMGDETAVRRLGRGLDNVARAGVDAFHSLGRLLPALGVLTSATTAAGIMRLTTDMSRFATQLMFASQRIGTTPQQLQAYQGAARLAGASTEQMTAGLQSFRDNLTNAFSQRGDPAFITMMNQLGINWKRDAMHARDFSEVLPQIADRIKAIGDPTVQARVLNTLGLGEGLAPVFRGGAQRLDELLARARGFGQVTPGGVEQFEKMRQATVGLDLAVQGLALRIGEKLAPVLTPLINQFADWISKSQAVKDFVAALADLVQRLGNYLGAVDWKAVGNNLAAFGSQANAVAKALGGWQPILEGLFAFMAARFAISMITPFVTLTSTIIGVGTEFRKLGGIPIPGWIGALTAAIQAWKDFQNPPVTRPEQWGPESPFWRGMPKALESQFPNSPVNQPPGGGPGFAERWFGTDIGARVRGWVSGLFGGGQQQQKKRPATPQDIGQIVNFFRSVGRSDEQIAAILASYQGESGFDLGAEGDLGASGGLAQWRGERRELFRSPRMFGHDVTEATPLEQAQYTQWELTHTETAANRALEAARDNLEAANRAVVVDYERPKDKALNAAVRLPYAEQWLARIRAMPQTGAAAIPAAEAPAGPTFQPAPADQAEAIRAQNRRQMDDIGAAMHDFGASAQTELLDPAAAIARQLATAQDRGGIAALAPQWAAQLDRKTAETSGTVMDSVRSALHGLPTQAAQPAQPAQPTPGVLPQPAQPAQPPQPQAETRRRGVVQDWLDTLISGALAPQPEAGVTSDVRDYLDRAIGATAQQQPAGAEAAVTQPAPAGAPVLAPPAAAGQAVTIRGGAATPQPAAQPQATREQTVRGSANVTVRFANKPPGTTVTATSGGELFQGPPRIEDAMVWQGF